MTMDRNEINQFHKNIIEHELDAMHAELHSNDYENVKYDEDDFEAECQDNAMWGNQDHPMWGDKEITDDEREYLATRNELDDLYEKSAVNLNELIGRRGFDANYLDRLNLEQKHLEGMKAIKELKIRLQKNLMHELAEELKTWPEVWLVEAGTEYDSCYIYDDPVGVQELPIGIYRSKEEAIQVVKDNFSLMREAGFKMERRNDGYPSCPDDIAPDSDGATSFIKHEEDIFEVRPGWTGEDGKTETAVYGWYGRRHSRREPFISAYKINVESDEGIEQVFHALLGPNGDKHSEVDPDIQRSGERALQQQSIQDVLAVLGYRR